MSVSLALWKTSAFYSPVTDATDDLRTLASKWSKGKTFILSLVNPGDARTIRGWEPKRAKLALRGRGGI